MKLENRVAIVTGAGKGIGRAIAEKLSQEGASVVVADINTDTATKTAADIGGLAHTVDVSNEEQVAGLINTTIGNYGKVDVLVNDAAIVPFTPWDDLDFVEWRRIMSVNLDGVYLTSRAVYPHMKEAGYGRIVNIASNVLVAGTPNLAHYVASKGGVFGFTRALATELGRYGITVNAVAPGLTASEGVLAGRRQSPRLSTSSCFASHPARAVPPHIALGRGFPRLGRVRVDHRCNDRRRWRPHKGTETEFDAESTGQMRLPPFRVHRPRSAQEASRLLAELGDEAAAYCGGTELLLAMKLGLAGTNFAPGNLKRVDGLRGVAAHEGNLCIGASATHYGARVASVLRARCPAMAIMFSQVANLRVRSVGTLGGNLCFCIRTPPRP